MAEISKKTLLEVKNLSKSFGDLRVLKDISMEVEQSEVISIIGPSGSGKSTFLRCLTMLEKIDGGSIAYCGETAVTSESGTVCYAAKSDLRRIQGYFGLVFQNFNLFPHYTALQNITDAPIHVQKRDKQEVMAEAAALLKKMGLSDKGDYYPYQLSGGQQQRVAIARALAMKPEILFFDEPTSALDPISTLKVEELCTELKRKYTIVIVTHNMQQAMRIADRTAFFLHGRIEEEGPTERIFNNPQNEKTREYIGGQFG